MDGGWVGVRVRVWMDGMTAVHGTSSLPNRPSKAAAQSTIEGGLISSTQHPSHLCTNNTPQSLKGYESWDPSDPDGKKTAKPIRSLDEN